jgi:hypothetical protein
MKLIDVYEAAKPEIMITHDCPSYAAQILCALNQKRHIDDGSRTRPALESMFNIHKPKLWIHGHWHLNSDQTIKGTRFICLNELAWVDINLDTGEVVNDGTTEFGCIKQEYPQTEEYDAGVIE